MKTAINDVEIFFYTKTFFSFLSDCLLNQHSKKKKKKENSKTLMTNLFLFYKDWLLNGKKRLFMGQETKSSNFFF